VQALLWHGWIGAPRVFMEPGGVRVKTGGSHQLYEATHKRGGP
jgi:hypothetical protein